MTIPLKRLFVRVADDTVEDMLWLSVYGWVLVAALQAATLVLAAVHGRLAGGDIVTPLVPALGGWFLLQTKSRAVAAALLVFAAATAILAAILVLARNGSALQLFIAIVAVWAGLRGLAATQFWQKRACVRPQWRHVITGSALAAVITLAAFAVVMIALNGRSGEGVAFASTAVLFLVPVAVLLWFTKRRAFAGHDPACPWPPKP